MAMERPVKSDLEAIPLASTPKGLRLHIAFFGRRNAGKSSLLNALVRQQVSIVSEQPGTTTDPVEKQMEFLPLGPVLFIDTPGIDDEGDVGALRRAAAQRVFDRADLAVLVVGDGNWLPYEDMVLEELAKRNTPVVVALNKADLDGDRSSLALQLQQRGLRVVITSARAGLGLEELRQALLELAPAEFFEDRPLLSDLVGPGRTAVLVIPIDKEAPKGRLILPQVQALRDLLDGRCDAVVTGEDRVREAIDRLRVPPAIVVTDSQAFAQVAAAVPESIPLTSFSILLARHKGDLSVLLDGTLALAGLRPGDRVLVAEACSHHPIADDIGRVKIPRWLNQKVGGELRFETVQGRDFPADLSSYQQVIMCGGCMINRKENLSRIARCVEAGVPVSNYGLAIAYSLGILERSLSPFPELLLRVKERQKTELAG